MKTISAQNLSIEWSRPDKSRCNYIYNTCISKCPISKCLDIACLSMLYRDSRAVPECQDRQEHNGINVSHLADKQRLKFPRIMYLFKVTFNQLDAYNEYCVNLTTKAVHPYNYNWSALSNTSQSTRFQTNQSGISISRLLLHSK